MAEPLEHLAIPIRCHHTGARGLYRGEVDTSEGTRNEGSCLNPRAIELRGVKEKADPAGIKAGSSAEPFGGARSL